MSVGFMYAMIFVLLRLRNPPRLYFSLSFVFEIKYSVLEVKYSALEVKYSVLEVEHSVLEAKYSVLLYQVSSRSAYMRTTYVLDII
jgi:hypothetical protein